MRQTSRAVALLLALDSAQAAATQIGANIVSTYNYAININQIMGGLGGPNNNPTGQLNDRTAPYNPCIQKLGTAPGTQRWTQWPASGNSCDTTNQWSGHTLLGQKIEDNDFSAGSAQDGKIAVVTNVSTCVQCIQQLGVWCSRTFNYQELSTATTYQYNSTASATALRSMAKSLFAGSMNGQTDNGTCCGASATMTGKMLYTTLGLIKAAAGGSAAVPSALVPEGRTYNKFACVAFSNGQTGTTNTLAVTAFMVTKPATNQNWWCSNGLFNAAYGSGANDFAYNVKTVVPDNANQRLELALVGCPQLGSICGLTAKTMIDLDTVSTAAASKVNMAADMGYNHKCTWMAYATKYNPTFILGEGTASNNTDKLGIFENSLKQTFILHHMEYNDEQLPINTGAYITTNIQTATTGGKGLDQYGKVPMFTMGNNLYSKQRTYYGRGTAVYNPSNWNSPYLNAAAATVTEYKGQQNYGSVATFASVSYLNAKYDARIVRYLPLQVAINDNTMGKAVATAYGTAKTSYDSAKTTWNNYVAILTKNAKVDAFSAAFAPPKAPTVPPLPNMPWKPDVSATMSQLSVTSTVAGIQWAGFSTFNKATATTTITAGVQPAANNFWITDDSVPLATGGGWGSFTAAILTYRKNWGKSYGTIGYEDSVANTKWNAMGAAYNPRFYCDSATAAGSCQKVYGAATSAAAGSGTGTINATVMYVAISLWSQGAITANYDFKAVCKNTAGSQFYSCLSIQWSRGTWNTAMAGLTAPASMTAATAADSLTGIVGAQALAASAAAAFTAAAALY